MTRTWRRAGAAAQPKDDRVIIHADFCEADIGHAHDCQTATELGRLRAFAGAVHEEFTCYAGDDQPKTEGHVDDCWHCAAAQALERAGV